MKRKQKPPLPTEERRRRIQEIGSQVIRDRDEALRILEAHDRDESRTPERKREPV